MNIRIHLLLLALGLAAVAGLYQTRPARAKATPRASAATLAPQALRPPGSRGDHGPSLAVFPRQELPLSFSHARHMGIGAMTCVFCHRGAWSSRSSAENLLPEPTTCDACHVSDHSNPDAVRSSTGLDACKQCHIGHSAARGNTVARVRLPPPNLHFDHAAHAARGIDCQQCHGQVQQLDLATRDQLPRMRGCLRCHQAPEAARDTASGECATCHLSSGPQLRTQFASGPMTPPRWMGLEHGPDWLERHRVAAAQASSVCANCHAESECIACHDGRVRPRRVHPNDFLSSHPVAARQNSPDCASCHRQQSFCLECHQRSGVAMTAPPANAANRGRVHPPPSVWTDPPRTPQHHSWEAQRNLQVCVSCHTERDCVVCHATTGVGGRGVQGGGSPHPPGFQSRCRQAYRKNARPCLMCHRADDPNLGPCQ